MTHPTHHRRARLAAATVLAALLPLASAHATLCGAGGLTHWDNAQGACIPNAAPTSAGTTSSNSTSGAGATASNTANANGAGGTGGAGGSVFDESTSTSTSRSWALGLVLPTVAGLPALPRIECASARVDQETSGQWLWGARTTPGRAVVDPAGCEVANTVNALQGACRWLSAKRATDLRLGALLPGYRATPDDGYADLTPHECAALQRAAASERQAAQAPRLSDTRGLVLTEPDTRTVLLRAAPGIEPPAKARGHRSKGYGPAHAARAVKVPTCPKGERLVCARSED